MWTGNPILRWRAVLGVSALLLSFVARAQESFPGPDEYLIVMLKGLVEVARSGAQTFDRAYTNQVLQVGDRVRVGAESQLALRNGQMDVYRFDEKSDFQIQAQRAPGTPRASFRLLAGILYFFHRDKPTDLEVQTRTASAAVRGTEFSVEVDDGGTTIVTVIDGVVDLTTPNTQEALTLTNGEQGIAIPGQAPFRRAAIDAINVIQWTLYYPGVLDARELPMTDAERSALEESIAAYESGDLLAALSSYPTGRVPQSDAERIYRAALLLAVGQVDDAQPLLRAVNRTGGDANSRLATALDRMIAVVKQPATVPDSLPELGTEWLVESYHQQSLGHLEEALAAGRHAIEKSPVFGFAWARVAELEFSFGRRDDSTRALQSALDFSPRNAQAITLNGFLYASRNRTGTAIAEFDRAIAIDGGLANAWLGRGLSRIHSADLEGGREDLLVAAALEPQRALLRSYLGKAWAISGNRKLAQHELELAKNLDQQDPTGWLYSALLKYQYNQINEGIRDLEKSQSLNDNRAVYRSRLLLDQDHAVRGANLARIYQDAGMEEVSRREAGRAVDYDYSNYAAHRFLAESYSELQDPHFATLRYDALLGSEFLMSNLLAPVGAGIATAATSEQEFSRLFEQNAFGGFSSTRYLSSGAWNQAGGQFGTIDNFTYSIEVDYRTDPGQRPNNDIELTHYVLQVKEQITPSDSIYGQVNLQYIAGGDPVQRYDPGTFNPDYRSHERLEPILFLGYHHDWSPASHTLLTFSRVVDHASSSDPFHSTAALFRTGDQIDGVQGILMKQRYDVDLELYSVEPQHIWEHENHTVIVGSRFQIGTLDTKATQTEPSDLQPFFPQPPAPSLAQDVPSNFHRFSIYAYDKWQIIDRLRLIGGFSYDYQTFPENFRDPPLSGDERTLDQVSPKAGLIFTPTDSTVLRGAFTRSLGGATLEDAFRIEPNEVAGFPQAYRSLIPEAIAGANAGAEFETYSLSIEQKFSTGTYLALTCELLNSELERIRGSFDIYPLDSEFALPSGQRERLHYRERSLLFTVNQLIGDYLATGLAYRLTDAHYSSQFTAVNDSVPTLDFQPSQGLRSDLHQVDLYAIFNLPSGFFFRGDAVWYRQSNHGYTPDQPGDDFWQFNLFAGYRFARRRAEATIGILNLADQDYRLSPLTGYGDLMRERTFYAKLKFNW